MPSPLTKHPRLSAPERRAQILDAAIAEFAKHGFHGARIEAIAGRAGISHPYLLRLFSNKRSLFVAAVDAAFDRIERAFRAAADAAEGDPLLAMGEAYVELLDRHDDLNLQFHAYAVASDSDVGPPIRERVRALRDAVQEISGAPPDRVRTFFAVGLSLTVAAALELPDRSSEASWAARQLEVA